MPMNKDERDDFLLVKALKAGRPTENDTGPARLEFERRRLMARLAHGEKAERGRGWKSLVVGSFAGVSAVAAAAAVLMLVVLPKLGLDDQEITLAGEWHLSEEDAIAVGTPVRVPSGTSATIVLPDGTKIWAGSDTQMTVEGEQGSTIRLHRGHLVAKVQPRGPDTQFKVLSDDAQVRVLGTFFSVTAGDDGTTVRLHEGKVKLECQDRAITMQPGYRIVANDDGLVAMEPMAEGEEIADLALSGKSAVPEEREVVSAVVAGSGADTVDGLKGLPVDSEDDPAATEESDDLLIAAMDENEAVRQTGSGKSAVQRIADRESQPDVEAVSLLDEAKALWREGRYAEIVEKTRGAGLDADILFLRGKALARLGRWYEAGDVYGAVAGISPSRRGEALYLSASTYGKARAFDRSYDMAQLAIGVGGPNADHAWRLKMVALSGQGRYSEAAQVAEDYLTRFKGGAHVAEAHFVRGTGLRLTRNWSQASSAYASYLSLGKGSRAMADDATFYLGYCDFKAGRVFQGRSRMEKYLADFPGGRHEQQAKKTLGL